MLRDYINATIGFQRLTTDIDETSENIMRMLSTTGNPGLNNLMSQLVSDTDFLTPCELHFRFGAKKSLPAKSTRSGQIRVGVRHRISKAL